MNSSPGQEHSFLPLKLVHPHQEQMTEQMTEEAVEVHNILTTTQKSLKDVQKKGKDINRDKKRTELKKREGRVEQKLKELKVQQEKKEHRGHE